MNNLYIESDQDSDIILGSKLSLFPKDSLYIGHKEDSGVYYIDDSLDLLRSERFSELRGKIRLIITSPPFPLNNKKSYGNLQGETYLDWFKSLAPIFSEMLMQDGSLVIELGNSWEPGRPVQSTLHMEALLSLTKHEQAGLRLIQQFVCYNPSRLPSPAQWVTIKRIRTVDSFTHVWWLAKNDEPLANNKNVLRPYSKSMKALMQRGIYNAGKRPSEHIISEKGFLKNHGGSIAHNLFELDAIDENRDVRLPSAFSFSNSTSNDYFHRLCKKNNIIPHPARMPEGLVSFFVKFLSEPDDIVLDPFAGSNTTGYVAASLERKWVSIDIKEEYSEQSKLRFKNFNRTKGAKL